MLANSKDPQLDAVEELPRVETLHLVSAHVVPSISEMQAQLSDVEETELVGRREVQAQKLYKAVLSYSQSDLDRVATSSRLGFLSELHIHFLDAFIEKRVII